MGSNDDATPIRSITFVPNRDDHSPPWWRLLGISALLLFALLFILQGVGVLGVTGSGSIADDQSVMPWLLLGGFVLAGLAAISLRSAMRPWLRLGNVSVTVALTTEGIDVIRNDGQSRSFTWRAVKGATMTRFGVELGSEPSGRIVFVPSRVFASRSDQVSFRDEVAKHVEEGKAPRTQ